MRPGGRTTVVDREVEPFRVLGELVDVEELAPLKAEPDFVIQEESASELSPDRSRHARGYGSGSGHAVIAAAMAERCEIEVAINLTIG